MVTDTPKTPAALYKMISIPEAQEFVLKETYPVGKVSVPLHEAVGRVLADSVKARDDLPPFPASIKVRHALTCNANNKDSLKLHITIVSCFPSVDFPPL